MLRANLTDDSEVHNITSRFKGHQSLVIPVIPVTGDRLLVIGRGELKASTAVRSPCSKVSFGSHG